MKPLDPLSDPDLVGKYLPGWFANFANRDKPEVIERNLKNAYQDVVDQIQHRLNKDMRTDPGNAGFALFEAFKDRIARGAGIGKEWKSFLWYYRYQAWPESFGDFAEKGRKCQEWIKDVEAIKNLIGEIRIKM